jgi:hypothetical protein
MVDRLVSGTSARLGRVGSNPISGTNKTGELLGSPQGGLYFRKDVICSIIQTLLTS